MNKENASKLWKIIQEAGDYLQGQLPEHPNHPKGRNPYAHVALCVREKFNSNGYKINDDEWEDKAVRLVAAWNTHPEDVESFLNIIKS